MTRRRWTIVFNKQSSQVSSRIYSTDYAMSDNCRFPFNIWLGSNLIVFCPYIVAPYHSTNKFIHNKVSLKKFREFD